MILVEPSQDILKRLKDLTIINQLVDTHFVENKIGQIEISKTLKEYDSVRNITEVIDYRLKSHRVQHKKNKEGLNIIISDLTSSKTLNSDEKICQCFARNINQIFLSELKSFKNTQKDKFKFFNQNWIQKIFSKKSQSDLVNFIIDFGKTSSWIIVPNFILEIIMKSKLFIESNNIENKSMIHKVGKLSSLDVFVNPNQEESFIYFANYGSIILLIDENIEEKETKSSVYDTKSISYTVNYLFIETGNTKMLEVQ